MKKQITIAILLFSSSGAFAQASQKGLDTSAIHRLTKSVHSLQSDNSQLKSKIRALDSKLSKANKNIDSLNIKTQDNSRAITQTANQLGVQIKESGDKNEGKITKVSESLSKNSLYGIIGVISALLLSGLLYWLLSARQKMDKTDMVDQLSKTKSSMVDQLSKTKSSIEESLVKEFGRQTELLDKQLEMLAQQKKEAAPTPQAEPDHSLALKVASEINLIERNINLMDKGTKGLKQLERSVGKLKDNLAANNYEMPELLGKQFHQGMNVIVASSIPDENLEKGAEIISKILIPQVNYNDKMIQTAQIEVSIGA